MRRLAVVLTVLGGLALGGPVLAQPLGGWLASSDGMQPDSLRDHGGGSGGGGDRMTAADAARNAQSQYGGRVLNVAPAAGGYRVKILSQGNVRVVFIPDR